MAKRAFQTLVLVASLGIMPSTPGAGLLSDPNTQQADGLIAYFGVMPAEIVRGHPAGHIESQMHGRPAGVPGEKHVIVALFDANTGSRITNARVSARVVGASADSARALEPMAVAGADTFGNYVMLPDHGSHGVRVEIQRPGQPRPAVVMFAYPLQTR